jgi:HPt (histidine-containing phosphotransfer) domain-containing protein
VTLIGNSAASGFIGQFQGGFAATTEMPLLRQEDRTPSNTDDIRQIVHRLAGSAGLFGYADISALAAAAEEDLIEHGSRSSLRRLLERLRELYPVS